MTDEIKKVLHEKFGILKNLAYKSKGFDTGAIERVLTLNSLLKINEIYEREEKIFKKQMEDIIASAPTAKVSLTT